MTDSSRNSSTTRRRIVTAALLTPVAAPFAALGAAENERGIVGQTAPELNVAFWLDGEGNPGSFSLNEQRGKCVHLKCWQSWCPGCHSSGFPTLQKLTEAFKDEPRVVNIAVQTVFEGHQTNTGDKVRDMQLRYELPIPMGHDPGAKGDNDHGYPNTMLSYRTGGTPWHILIAPDGTVVFDGFRMDAEKVIEYLNEDLAKPA